MPRRSGVPKRDVLPDPMYNSKVIAKLINQVMLDGKKGIAQSIVYDAFDAVKEKTGKDAMEVFNQALENIMPVLEVKARRVGGSTIRCLSKSAQTAVRRLQSDGWLLSLANAAKRP